MRVRVRVVPWLLALVGLAIPMIGSGFIGWPFVAVWLVVLALAWIFSRRDPGTREQRMTLAVLLLPVLFLLGWEGGWWLIPADLAWLVIEFADRGRAGEPRSSRIGGAAKQVDADRTAARAIAAPEAGRRSPTQCPAGGASTDTQSARPRRPSGSACWCSNLRGCRKGPVPGKRGASVGWCEEMPLMC